VWEVAQTMYIHVNKCKNEKLKGEKKNIEGKSATICNKYPTSVKSCAPDIGIYCLDFLLWMKANNWILF
jgi:hypothetical protein